MKLLLPSGVGGDKRILLSPPTPDGRSNFILDFLIYIKERGRPGSAVEIFVRATDGKICIRVIELNGNRASRMTQIPKDKRAFAMGKLGDVCHIVKIAALERDMGESHKRSIFIDGGFERV